MPRREQPYLPLYVMDFLTDEKLRECSAASVGVYIMLMCVMHKQEVYGTISLRPKDRQSEDILQDFATKLGKHLPFDNTTIAEALRELISEGVLHLEEETLVQKRMVRDADISEKRAAAGKKGSTATNAKNAATKDAEPVEAGEGGRNRQRGVCEEIAALYNEICVSFPKIKRLSEARKKAIKARLANGYTVESFRELFQMAEASSFLKGKNDRNWQATFDWLIKDSNMAKVIDGNYADNKGGSYGTYAERGRDRRSTGDPGGFKPSGGFRGDGK